MTPLDFARDERRECGARKVDSPDYFIGVAQQAMWILALASAPILIPALVAGVVLGMIQAATSINEQTLSFVPKLIIVGGLRWPCSAALS